MKLEEVKALTGTDTIISIDGKEQTHSLPDDMTIEKFKSFLLTLTGNKRFDLKLCTDNKQTLGDLKAKSDKIEVKAKYSSRYDLEYTINGEQHTYKDAKDETKLIDFKKDLLKKFGDEKKYFTIFFKTEEVEKVDA